MKQETEQLIKDEAFSPTSPLIDLAIQIYLAVSDHGTSLRVTWRNNIPTAAVIVRSCGHAGFVLILVEEQHPLLTYSFKP